MSKEKKQRVKFTATSSMRSFNDVPFFKDGDVHEVTKAQADHFTTDFADNFKKVGKAKEVKAPAGNKADSGPDSSK